MTLPNADDPRGEQGDFNSPLTGSQRSEIKSIPQVKCPTCMGSGKVEILLDTQAHEAWDRFKGTKKLWDKYSHAADNYPTGHKFSGYCKIMSFTKEKNKGIYSLNTTRGSWPYVTEKELLTRFKFISRRTGQEVKFEGIDLVENSPDTTTNQSNPHPKGEGEHL